MLITKLEFDEFNMQVLTVTNTVTGEVLTTLVLKALKKVSGDIFKHVNEYQKTLSNETSDKIFEKFRYIQDELDRDHNSLETTSALKKVIREIIALYDYNAFMDWYVKNSSDVFIHEKISDKFVEDTDLKKTKVKTYIASEYIELTGLVTFVRALLPTYLQQLVYLIEDKYNHPYFNIFKLFIGSEIDKECTALERLRDYVDVTYRDLIGNTRNVERVIGAGLSADDVVDNLVGIDIFDKLLTLDFIESRSNGASRIHTSVGSDGTFETSETKAFKTKFNSKGENSNKDARSRFECYSLITELGMDDIAYIEHGLKDLIVDPDNFDFDAYEKEKKNIPRYLENKIEPTRLELLGWLIKDIIDPRALLSEMSQRRMVELLLMGKVHLMNTEHKFIGMLLGSVVDTNTNYISSNIVVKDTMSPTLMRELEEMFVYTVYTHDGKSAVVKDIIEKSKKIVNMTWRSYGAYDGRYINAEGILLPPLDINKCLVDYVRYILYRVKK